MLTRLDVCGFKCFDEEELSLGSITLLSGLNSSGKSSFLQAIRLLKEGKALPGHGTLEDLKSKAHVGFDLCLRKGKDAYGLEYTEKSQIEYYDDNKDIIPDLFSFISASRLGPQPYLPTSPSAELLSVGEKGEYVLDFFLRNYERADVPEPLRKADKRTSSFRQNVTAWLDVISPGVTFDAKVDRMADMGRAAYNDFRASNVGFGLSYTLPIIVNVLVYASLVESGEYGSALILVENPEAHLHPSGQTRIGDFLARAASCGVQIVVETHSDHLLNGIRLAVKEEVLSPEDTAFYYFAYDFKDDFTTIEQPVIDRFGMFDEWPDGFFDEAEKSLGRLL